MSKFNWDRNNDGNISANDVLNAFDENNDGVLDADELRTLSEQLSSQVADNNALLVQIGRLETENFAYRKELQTIKDAGRSSEQSKSKLLDDVEDCRKKLKLAQDVADNLTKQIRDARADHAMTKRDAEALANENHRKNKELEVLKQENLRLQRRSDDIEKQKSSFQKTLEAEYKEKERVFENEKKMQDVLKKELETLRSQLNTESNEKVAALEAYNQVKSAFESVQIEHERASLNKLQDDRKIKYLNNALDSLTVKNNEMESALHDALSSAENQQVLVSDLKDEVQALKIGIAASDDAQIELQIAVKRLASEKQALQHQLEKLRVESATAAQKLKGEGERQVEQLSSKNSEMQRLLEQARARCDEVQTNAAQRIYDLQTARTDMDKKYMASQKECQEVSRHDPLMFTGINCIELETISFGVELRFQLLELLPPHF
jgi:chromosome segregation ATPase